MIATTYTTEHDLKAAVVESREKPMQNDCNDIHDKARLKSNCREKSWKVDAEIIATTYTTEHDLKAIVVESRCLY